MEKAYISLLKYIDAALGRAVFNLVYKFKYKVKGYYINEIKLINFVERFYNENCLAEIFRVSLALMGEPPL